jgi:hypothetical protein
MSQLNSRPLNPEESAVKMNTATVSEVNEASLDHLTWLDSKEAAKYLRKSVPALRQMVYRGYIRPRKFQRRLYFRRSELDWLLESSPF